MTSIYSQAGTLRVALLIAIFTVGCDGADNGADGVSEKALEDIAGMMTSVSNVLGEISLELDRGTRQKTSSGSGAMPETYRCNSGGHVLYDVAGSATDYGWSLIFEDCAGIKGNLDLGLQFSEPGAQPIVSRFMMDGELSERCTLGFDDWKTASTIAFDQTTVAYTGTVELDGAISARCGNERFSCRYTNVSFDLEDTNDEGLDLYTSYCK